MIPRKLVSQLAEAPHVPPALPRSSHSSRSSGSSTRSGAQSCVASAPGLLLPDADRVDAPSRRRARRHASSARPAPLHRFTDSAAPCAKDEELPRLSRVASAALAAHLAHTALHEDAPAADVLRTAARSAALAKLLEWPTLHALPAQPYELLIERPALKPQPTAPDTAPTAPVAPAVTPTLPPTTHLDLPPAQTVFISLCFEGPDGYATAGGLGTRVAALTETLAAQGYETHLLFVGDPRQPGLEDRMDGKLHLARWCQWISQHHPHGVYDGEDAKVSDYSASAPPYVVDTLVAQAVAQGKRVVIVAEDWHTTEALCRVSDLLHERGWRKDCVLLWNCNSLLGLHRVDFARLNASATLTTVSRYMKHKLWDYGVNPLVIPNGIPSRYLEPVDMPRAARLRRLLLQGDAERHVLFKMARFDPDKRWLMTVEAVARLKAQGQPVVLLMRGGIEAHGAEVVARAKVLGLQIRDVTIAKPVTPESFLRQMRAALAGAPTGRVDIYHLHGFLPPDVGRMCYAAADATLANSGHEPFGLVGLEVMAAGGIAFTGSTGEDYAVSFENAIALETDDPDELVGYLTHLRQHPELRQRLRAAGQRTARAYTWEAAIATLAGKLGYVLRKQQ